VHWSYVCCVGCRKGPPRIGVPFKPLTLLLGLTVPTASGGTRGRLAGARAPARKFFPASPFVK